MLVVVLNPLCPVRLSLLLYYIYLCFSDPNITISVSISITVINTWVQLFKLTRPEADLWVVMENFMKFSWRENFIEIFTLKFFKNFTV